MTRVYPVPFEGQSIPEFGIDAARVGIITIPLDNALDKKRFEIGGTFIWAATASDDNAEMTIALSQFQADQGIPFKKRTAIGGIRFSEIFITCDAQAGKSITLFYTVEDAFNSIRIENPVGDIATVDLSKPGAGASVVDEALAINTETVIAADADRRSLVVFAHPNNTEYLRVGPNAADTNGYLLGAGQAYTYTATTAFTVRNPSTNAATQTFGYITESN